MLNSCIIISTLTLSLGCHKRSIHEIIKAVDFPPLLPTLQTRGVVLAADFVVVVGAADGGVLLVLQDVEQELVELDFFGVAASVWVFGKLGGGC